MHMHTHAHTPKDAGNAVLLVVYCGVVIRVVYPCCNQCNAVLWLMHRLVVINATSCCS
jgi:hypothetical protein